MNTLKGKKIELLPIKIENEKTMKHCPKCEGIGWVEKNKGYIEKCLACFGTGYVRFCSECGKELKYSGPDLCDACWEKQRVAKLLKEEQLCFDKSEKLFFGKDDEKIKKFDCFYSIDYSPNEGFFYDFEDFFEEMHFKGLDQNTGPKYVWATSEEKINVDIDNLLENACEDLHEGAYDSISNEDYKELKDFIEKWCKKQTGTITYYPNYYYAIMVPWEDF